MFFAKCNHFGIFGIRKMRSFKLLRAKFAKNICCKKAKIIHGRTDFWRFQTSAQKDQKSSPYLVHFLSPFPKNVLQKPLCCIPTSIFAPWTKEIMKIMDADGDGVITTNELNQLKVDLYGMGWWDDGMMRWSTLSKTFGFLCQKMLSMKTWNMKTDWNLKWRYKNPSKNLKIWPYHRKTHQQKIPGHEMCGGTYHFGGFSRWLPTLFGGLFWGEESRALRGEIWNEGTRHGFPRWWQLKYFLFSPLFGEDSHFD